MPFNITQSVRGWILPRGGMIRVAATQPGIVAALAISQGQFVRRGDVVATLRFPTEAPAGDTDHTLKFR
jgi:membrane fusion protein